MSVINVTVTSAGAANVSVSNGSTVNATVGNGGAVNVSTGTISPGNATVVSGTLAINSTTTLAAGAQAYVVNNGTAYAAKLDIGIPAGPATSVTVGNTTTLDGGNASVMGTTNGSTLTLAFAIPRGANGTNGTNGTNGVTPSFAIGNTSTLSSGSSATVTATPSNGGANITLDFGIPRGADGTSGSSSWSSLTGVPSNFPTNTTLVSGLSAGYSAANHAHNYVTSLNNLTGGLTLAAGGNVTLTANGSTLTIAASGGLGENDAVDGGNYVGEIIGGITFSLQPQSQTVTVNAAAVSFGNVSSNITIDSSSADGMSAYGSRLYITRTASDQIWSSGDDGSTWSQLASFARSNPDVSAVAYAPPSFASNGTRTLFCAGLDSETSLRYSDNADLSSSTAISNISAQSVCYLPSAGRFIASGVTYYDGATSYGGVMVSSSDAANWTVRLNQGVAFTSYRHLFVLSGKVIAVLKTAGQSETYNVVHVSSDGVNWTSANMNMPSAPPSGAAASSTRIVVVNGTSSTRYTSDGVNWITGSLPVSCDRISYAAGLFWAMRSLTSTDICTSPDGITWTLRDAGLSRQYQSVAAASGSNLAFIVTNSSPLRATITTSTASANLTVSASASGGNPVSYQWQRSVDAGTNWNAIANATSATLNLTGLVQSDSGTRYRAAASATGATTAFSQSATLTVT